MLASFANYWSATGWHVTVIVADLLFSHEETGYPKSFFNLDSSITLVQLPVHEIRNRLPRRIRILIAAGKLRRAILKSKPDVVMGFKTEGAVYALFALTGRAVPVVAMERTDPRGNPVPRAVAAMRNRLYKRAAAITCHSIRSIDFFTEPMRKKVVAIPNSVRGTDTYLPPDLKRTSKRKVVLSLGRLNIHQKRVDRLIEAFASVAPRFPDWELQIWGDGTDRLELENLAQKLQIESCVKFMGRTENVANAFMNADLFVMTSDYEGFGLALAEAMAFGLPVIACDCPVGPSEIIRHEIDGLLVPLGDDLALINSMERLMNDESERKRFGDRATEVVARFSEHEIMKQWRDLITRVA